MLGGGKEAACPAHRSISVTSGTPTSCPSPPLPPPPLLHVTLFPFPAVRQMQQVLAYETAFGVWRRGRSDPVAQTMGILYCESGLSWLAGYMI